MEPSILWELAVGLWHADYKETARVWQAFTRYTVGRNDTRTRTFWIGNTNNNEPAYARHATKNERAPVRDVTRDR